MYKPELLGEFGSKSRPGDRHYLKRFVYWDKEFVFCSCPFYKYNSTCGHIKAYQTMQAEDKEAAELGNYQ